MGGSWGGEGLLHELLEGTDSEAAVAHLGVRGTLSLRLGGQRVAVTRGSTFGPRSLLLGPFPGEPSLALLPPSLTLGTLSNCTKVAVCQSYPTPGWGLCFQSFLPTASAPIPDNLLVPLYSWIAQLCVCVFGGWGWVLAGVGLVGVWEGLGERWRMKVSYPLPPLQATEAWEGGCLLSLPCVLQMCQNGGGWEGRVPGRATPRVALSKQYSSSCLGDGKTGERVGLGTWGFPVYSCVYSGVFSVWYPLWASTCV